jgi:hypothetical protein
VAVWADVSSPYPGVHTEVWSRRFPLPTGGDHLTHLISPRSRWRISLIRSPASDISRACGVITRRWPEVNADRAPAYPRVIEELIPAACHVTEQYANNSVEADHGPLEARLRPMRNLKLRSVRVISAVHAFAQNLRRGYYELCVDTDRRHRHTAIFTELVRAV